MQNPAVLRRPLLSTEAVLALTDSELLELVVRRVAGLVARASAVAERSRLLPCLDPWATRERLAKINDVVFAGQRLLQRLAAD